MRTRSPIWHSCFSSWALYFSAFITIFPYFRLATRRSTFTTTVFVILFETTTPTRDLRLPRSMSLLLRLPGEIRLTRRGRLGRRDLLLACHGQDPRDLALGLREVRRRVEPAGRVLVPEVEHRLLELRRAHPQLLRVELAQLIHGRHRSSSYRVAPRFTILVETGSLWAARWNAFFADSSSTPASS